MRKWFIWFLIGAAVFGVAEVLYFIIIDRSLDGVAVGTVAGLSLGYLAGYFAAKEDTEKVIK